MKITISEPIFKNGTLRTEAYSEDSHDDIFYIETQGITDRHLKEILKRDLEILSREISKRFIKNIQP